MPTAPRVSVVLPARDAANTIVGALESLRQQTWENWELWVVDDGSRDQTATRVEAAARQDPRIHLLRQSPAGLVPALTAGLQQAHGAFIARMDADDWSHPDRFRAQVALLESSPDLGVVGCRVEFGGDPIANAGYALHVDWLNSLVSAEQIALNRFVESPFAHPSAMFRRDLLGRWGGYREGPFPEDYELWLRWLEAGVRMAKVPETLLRWNDSPNRLSRTDPRYDSEAFSRIKAAYLAPALERIRHGRQVWVWGAGRLTRVRAEHLSAHGIRIHGYIDIDPNKTGRTLNGRPIVAPADLPSPKDAVVAGYVAKRGARELDRSLLIARGYREGEDFWMAA